MAYPQYKKNTFKEYYFNTDFVNIISNHINQKGLRAIYDINTNTKYTLDKVVEAVVAICTSHYGRLRLPGDLCQFMDRSEYQKYSKHSIKSLVKQYMLKTNNSNDTFFTTYVVIGYDVPIPIKELTITI